MKREISLLKNNDELALADIEWVYEFYRFLQGNVPEGMSFKRGHKIKLTEKQAFSIIWYLQEHFPLLPDHIERCDACGQLYDSYSQGHHSELTGKFYCCESCEPTGLYEKEQRVEKKQSKGNI